MPTGRHCHKPRPSRKNTRLATAAARMHMLGVLASTSHRQYAGEAAFPAATAAAATPTRAGACGVCQVCYLFPALSSPARSWPYQDHCSCSSQRPTTTWCVSTWHSHRDVPVMLPLPCGPTCPQPTMWHQAHSVCSAAGLTSSFRHDICARATPADCSPHYNPQATGCLATLTADCHPTPPNPHPHTGTAAWLWRTCGSSVCGEGWQQHLTPPHTQ